MEFLNELKKIAGQVDAALNRYLLPESSCPEIIHRAMRYSIFAGGKRLRPAMLIAAAEAVGGSADKVMPAACALELIHTYSLIHDDLPSMDDDDYRRGKPTNHKVFGEAMAILAGDALLTMSFQLLAGLSGRNGIAPADVVRVIADISAAAGTTGLIGGQVVDIVSANQEIDAGTLEYIHTKKTGALFRAAIRSGAVLSGADDEELKSLTNYAEHFGLAFQITDDILDVAGDMQKTGKPVGSDEKNNKATYPALYGLEEAYRLAGYSAEQALYALEPFGEKANFLKELVKFVVNRDH
ncbi:Polyprenyl synthetase [Desulfofarcimen acetoxidans DSM 771]|uniref:Farnesyl diphosphate synthase n=1 Tax=Desulfofarcimen acetoxidans (strain ATCC 49208 / DSM 771 / KCTC 5769 / VKM B-1644 / 5575) TaxID=485916 RepID=C8W0Y3_DESAS|nr:farnesyl diphosphate synthase [Desulfofarcimen acetoxidans]ACV63379.1 Polyprenyl synthetase [Desulfofarcimen acetoxidans DSM 771]